MDGIWTWRADAPQGSRFDAAICSPDGEIVVRYHRFGTDGVVMHRNDIVRTIWLATSPAWRCIEKRGWRRRMTGDASAGG